MQPNQSPQCPNQRVIRDGGMDQSAELKWSMRSAADIQRWNPRIHLLAEYPLFRGVKRGLSLKEKWGMFLFDKLRIMSMVHLTWCDQQNPA